MPKAIVSINFYGHPNPNISGVRYGFAPLNRHFFKEVAHYFLGKDFNRVGQAKLKHIIPSNRKLWFYDYYSALNENDNKMLAKFLVGHIMMEISKEEPNNNTPEIAFLITGFSAGGITALHMAIELERIFMNVFYVGLADAAFIRNESEYLMTGHGLMAKYKKNYFQTKGNHPEIDEIHDEITGFINFNLNEQLTGGEDLHQSACSIGNSRILEDVKWCINKL